MKKIVLLIMTLFVFFACSEKPPTQVTISDANEDGSFHAPPSSGLLGNVDLHVMPVTIQGSAIVLINGPGASIGYDIRDRDDSSFIYFADSYIGAGAYAMQTGTQIPMNKWTHIRLVVYKSGLSGYVVSFLDLLGLDFFDSIESYMIEAVYEADFMFVSNTSIRKTGWTKCSMEMFKKNTQNQTLKKAVFENRSLLEQNGINIGELLVQFDELKTKK